MRNLFICHTQAQLSLACGLALGRFQEDVNELVLYRDFSLSETMQGKLAQVFSHVCLLQGIYPGTLNTYKAKLLYYPVGLRLIHKRLHGKYDRVFVICDTVLLTQKIIQFIWRNNHHVQFSWLEDGITAYYQDTDVKKGLDRNPITMFLRTIVFKYTCGCGRFYSRLFPEMGGASCISDSYVLFPKLVREPYYSARPIIEISKDEYYKGLHALYSVSPIRLDERSIILVVDLLSRYKYPTEVCEQLGKRIVEWQNAGYTVYCKFHPREEQTWSIFSSCEVLDSRIGIESMYLSLYSQRHTLLVVGIKSTSLVSAKILGFNVLSLFPICLEENENLLLFYRALDIEISR